VHSRYTITLHKRDKDLLLKIKSFFGEKGSVTVKDKAYYNVTNTKDLIETIIPHFEKYPLFTKKQYDFFT
jgi:hypothetical protein